MDDADVAPVRHRLSVDDHHRMAEVGILRAEDRVELIDGDLIDTAPIGQENAAAVSRLTEALVIACAGRPIVWPQNPIRLNEASEPHPDLAVAAGRFLRARGAAEAGGRAAGG